MIVTRNLISAVLKNIAEITRGSIVRTGGYFEYSTVYNGTQELNNSKDGK